jgi:alkylation response protein AidB-like acyl-CoA dehydrogenase
MRATVSHEVAFLDAPIPCDHAVDVRAPAEWLPSSKDQLFPLWNALGISTIYTGVAYAARDWLRDYLSGRAPTNLGAALATLPRVQEKFGEIEALRDVLCSRIHSPQNDSILVAAGRTAFGLNPR